MQRARLCLSFIVWFSCFAVARTRESVFSNSSCHSCGFVLPQFTEYYWVSLSASATTTKKVPTATEFVYYYEGTTTTIIKAVPSSEYTQFITKIAPTKTTITVTYASESTFTTVLTYPTPFLDYGTAYTILGNWSASSTCIREGFTSLVPSSHPIFSQPTIAPAPVSSPGSVYSLTSISLSPSSSIEVRAVVDPTSAFYCSAFSDQGPLHICSSTSLSSFATSASSAAPSPSPITHTTVAFLTQTQAPKSLDAAAFAALIASVERGEKSKKPPQASSSRINAESEVVGKGSTAGQGPYSTAGVPKQSATNDIPGSVTSTPPSVTVQNTHTANSDPETENSEDPLHSNGGGTVPRIRSSTAWPVYVAGSHSLTMTTTEIGATIPATGDSGPQIDPTTPIPAVIIGGQTLTALDPSAAVTINGATAHLTIVSAGGMTKTGVVFSSPGAKPSTVVIPAQGAGESNTAGGSGGETVSLNCRGLGGCSSASGTATETGTATGQNVQQFTAGAARDVGSREIYTVVVVLISVLFVNG